MGFATKLVLSPNHSIVYKVMNESISCSQGNFK
jgi:hypothetical protein